MAVPAQFNFTDGGERGPLSYYVPLGITGVNNIAVVNGKSYFYVVSGGATQMWWKSPGFSSKTAYWTWRGQITGSGVGAEIVVENTSGAELIHLQFNADYSISLYSGATLLGTSAPRVWNLNTIFQVSFGGVLDPAAGTFLLYINGNPTPFLNLSALNTANGQTDYNATTLYIFSGNSGAGIYSRDLSCHDGTAPAPLNAPLGDCGAELTMPNGNVSSQLTPSTGSSNAAIYAATPPGSAYCGSSTVGAVDKVTIAPLPANALSVIGFKAFDYALKSDTGARAIQKGVISGGTTVAGAENYLNETAVPMEDIYTTDPATGVQITVAAYNALELTETIAA